MGVLIYPGSFDPFTSGHLDIIERAVGLGHDLRVVVLPNAGKKPAFTLEERVAMIAKSVSHLPGVMAESYDGRLVDYYQKVGAIASVRGVRGPADIQFESEQAFGNRLLYDGYEVLFFPCRPELLYTSSTMVKDVARFGGSLVGLVPEAIRDDVCKKLCPERSWKEDR